MYQLKKLPLATIVSSILLLTACGDDKIVEVIKEVEVEVPAPVPAPVNFSYEVTVTNLTNSQPLSPVAVILHKQSHVFSVGGIASLELEQMAEGGDNSGWMNWGFGLASRSGAAPIGPGASETIMITIEDVSDANLSLVSMLVNTNDGFSGLDAWNVSQLAVGDSWTTNAFTYDAGTEANDEIVNGGGASGVSGIPANPGMNGGTNASGVTSTEANQMIHIHRGNIGDTDATGGISDVDSRIHRWLNPVAKVTVTVK